MEALGIQCKYFIDGPPIFNPGYAVGFKMIHVTGSDDHHRLRGDFDGVSQAMAEKFKRREIAHAHGHRDEAEVFDLMLKKRQLNFQRMFLGVSNGIVSEQVA
jgi:hypothetical protein